MKVTGVYCKVDDPNPRAEGPRPPRNTFGRFDRRWGDRQQGWELIELVPKPPKPQAEAAKAAGRDGKEG